ncbi:TetR/AcrR family transcriptional regulator, partial [Leptolyngbya sp. FACHB-671]
FFAAVTVEFDSRPSVVRDRLVDLMQQWLNMMEQFIQEAKDLGELRPDVDASQLAFELHATMWGANAMAQLFEETKIAAQTRRAIADRLNAIRPC